MKTIHLFHCLFNIVFLLDMQAGEIDNFIMNGSFEEGNKGFRLSSSGSLDNKPDLISFTDKEHSNGNNSLCFNFSTEEIVPGLYIQQNLPLNRLKPVKCLTLKAKIFIEKGENPAVETDGAFYLRLRQWKKGFFLRDALKIYCRFNKDVLRIIEKKYMKNYPRLENNYMDKWILVESIAPIDSDADALDMLCGAESKKQPIIYVDEIVLKESEMPIMRILEIPQVVKRGTEIIQMKADITVAADHSMMMHFILTDQTGNNLLFKDFKLTPGVQAFELPLQTITAAPIILNFKITNSDGELKQVEMKKIECIEDPFSE